MVAGEGAAIGDNPLVNDDCGMELDHSQVRKENTCDMIVFRILHSNPTRQKLFAASSQLKTYHLACAIYEIAARDLTNGTMTTQMQTFHLHLWSHTFVWFHLKLC